MKKKITVLVYVPLSGTTSEIHHRLIENQRSLSNRGLSAQIERDPDRIVATLQEDFPQSDGSCPFNAYFDDRLLEGMRIQSVTVTYHDAIMARRSKSEMDVDKFFLNGSHTDLYMVGSTARCLTPIVTCLSSRRIVSIFLEIKDGSYEEKNHHRKALLGSMSRVERVIQASKAAKQLIQAFRMSPQNKGFIERSIKELYAAIGCY